MLLRHNWVVPAGNRNKLLAILEAVHGPSWMVGLMNLISELVRGSSELNPSTLDKKIDDVLLAKHTWITYSH